MQTRRQEQEKGNKNIRYRSEIQKKGVETKEEEEKERTGKEKINWRRNQRGKKTEKRG